MFADREETIGACLRSKGEKKIWQGWQLLSVSAVEWRSRNRFAVPQHRFFMRHSSATWHLIATTGVADILAMELKGKMMRGTDTCRFFHRPPPDTVMAFDFGTESTSPLFLTWMAHLHAPSQAPADFSILFNISTYDHPS